MRKTGIGFFKLLTKNELSKQVQLVIAYDQKNLGNDIDEPSLSSKLCLTLSLLSPKRRAPITESSNTPQDKKQIKLK